MKCSIKLPLRVTDDAPTYPLNRWRVEDAGGCPVGLFYRCEMAEDVARLITAELDPQGLKRHE